MKPRLIGAASVLCIGLMCYFTFSSHGRPAAGATARQAHAADGEADARDEKLMELQRQVDMLQQMVAERAPAKRTHANGLQLREPSAVELRANREVAIGKYEGAFKGGAAHPGKDSAMEDAALSAALSDKMAALASLPVQPEVDCKGEMCRVSGRFDTPSAADAWATYYVMEMTESLPGSRYFLEPGPEGVRIRLYMFTRNGGTIMTGIDRGAR